MARRRTRRPRDATATRRVLLEAATLVFADQGFAGARVDEISARAGVNKALIYAYYGDKKGLYRAVLESRLSEVADPVLSKTVAREVGPRRALEELIRRYFRLLLGDRPYARLLAWQLLSSAREGHELILDSARPFLDLISELVQRGRASGELPADADPELFLRTVISLALGYALHDSAILLAQERGGPSRTDEQFVDYACRLLLRPLGRRERRTA